MINVNNYSLDAKRKLVALKEFIKLFYQVPCRTVDITQLPFLAFKPNLFLGLILDIFYGNAAFLDSARKMAANFRRLLFAFTTFLFRLLRVISLLLFGDFSGLISF